ncbi:MAG: hypothetical protein J0L92_11410 [Deltaproteobacteria bacterium]|nr:hypothetical protein [Deltaproteobacteria bacterium]
MSDAAAPDWLARLDRWLELAPSLDVFFTTLLDALEGGLFRVDDERRAVVADEDGMNALARSRGVCFDRYGY